LLDSAHFVSTIVKRKVAGDGSATATRAIAPSPLYNTIYMSSFEKNWALL